MDRRKKGNCNKEYRQSTRKSNSGKGESSHKGQERGSRKLNMEKPPPELKGKALGLWYRDRQVQKNKNKSPTRSVFPVITLPRKKFETIEFLLDETRKSKNHMMESKFKQDFLSKIKGSFLGDIEKLEDNNRVNEPKKELKMPVTTKEVSEFRAKLPCYKMQYEILEAIRDNQIVVISGETGCGKTTQIVQYVLDEEIEISGGSNCNIVCTQPRRISAISVAERVAFERGEKLGLSVGYQIRLEGSRTRSTNGSIMFVTTGIILQWMQKNPLLTGISHLFLDEVHERDILCDFVLACLLQIIKKRSDLKVILMSATLNAERFSSYFGGAPCIHIPGFTYPVEEIYLETVLELTKFSYDRDTRGMHFEKKKGTPLDIVTSNYIKELEKSGIITRRVADELKNSKSEQFNACLIAALVQHICIKEEEGAILVFVPGMGEIQDVIKALRFFHISHGERYKVIPLHSTLPTLNQRDVFNKFPAGVRKIVIATNIAETSITIDDVVFVIDCGFIKIKQFDKKLNVSSLDPGWIAISNARQRRGRAGRVQAGKCYKLYTSHRESYFEPYPLPEIQRSRLDEVVLQVKMLKLGKAEAFLETVLDPPDPQTVKLSVEILHYLNALDADEHLTPLGFHLAKLPLEPQIGKMILMAAVFSCVDPILSIAACLSYKEPFCAPFELQNKMMQGKLDLSRGLFSDHYVYHAAMKGWEKACQIKNEDFFTRQYFLSKQTLRLLRDMKKQFAGHLFDMQFLATIDPNDANGNVNSQNKQLVQAIICAGLYPNIAVVGRGPSMLKTQDHPNVKIHKRSLFHDCKNFPSPYLVYHMMLRTSSIFVHSVTSVNPWSLLFFGKNCDVVEFDGISGIRVDDLVKVNCFKKTAMLIMKLRMRLDNLLADAVSNPGVIDWSSEEKPPVLMAIVELITESAEGAC